MNCQDLKHPFQNDPGVSQNQRVMRDLLQGAANIDGRTMADLLDYFVQLSRLINYYDTKLNISDWQPFFQKSAPFILASIIRYNRTATENKLAAYKKAFQKKPSKAGLQLLLHFVNDQLINKINEWRLNLEDDTLPVKQVLTSITRSTLNETVKQFIVQHNAATKWYCVKPIGFIDLVDKTPWAISLPDTFANYTNEAFKATGKTKRKRLLALYNRIADLVPSLLNAIRIISGTAEQSLQQSLFPLKTELQEKHPPHLALLFAFLKLFTYLQGDLNSFTKKHLDFFYKRVLQLQPQQAVPDKAHIVFEIQNTLNAYLLKKGLLLKDGKDINKQEILFATDQDIVVNKAQVADKRTLFLNNQTIADKIYLEGVYMAPDAGKANGIDKEFKEEQYSWPTLGAHYSKFIDPENKFVQPYPNARLGFVLASPVLLLNEGTRKITISLKCLLKTNYCSDIHPVTGTSNPCCDDTNQSTLANTSNEGHYDNISDADALRDKVVEALGETWYYINRTLIAAAVKKGISKDIYERLDKMLTILHYKPGKKKDYPYRYNKEVEDADICYCPVEEKIFETTLTAAEYEGLFNTVEEREIVKEFFPARKALTVSFSGEKEWIKPETVPAITLSAPDANHQFTLTIIADLLPHQKAVTFYNAENLKEELNTTLPVVKVELDDKIKFLPPPSESISNDCCDRKPASQQQLVSLYHFFRNVLIVNNSETKIETQVCGVKNFVVQNDESLQNVNAPIYPFGTRPEIIDFDIKHPPQLVINPPNPALITDKNLIGPNFYIGSQEVFCKKWDDVYINIEWKDKPTNFEEHYKAFLKDGTKFGLDKDKFLINVAVQENGNWQKETTPQPATVPVRIMNANYNNRRLFNNDGAATWCTRLTAPMQTIRLQKTQFSLQQAFRVTNSPLKQLDVNTANGFIKLNLQVQDFCHKVYSYVLARQMMALGRQGEKDNTVTIEDAIYYNAAGDPIVFSTDTIKDDFNEAGVIAQNIKTKVNDNTDGLKAKIGGHGDGDILEPEAEDIRSIFYPPIIIIHPDDKNLTGDADDIVDKLNDISGVILNNDKFQAIIPKEPWTPVIKEISIDYKATATITDIDLIHLYPYTSTYKAEELETQPPLFPTFCDEGNLFLGLKDLQPGSNLNMLFQLAEATADSESKKEDVQWYYLENNTWKLLRTGFEVLADATEGLTTSGIIQFALPGNITNENTVMPKGLHWIKAAIPKNSRSVAETMGIFTQAVRTTFTNDDANDKQRLNKPLDAGSLAKLKVADTAIKKITQPFETFDAQVPEESGNYYVRASELLHHKGRAIQKLDYERLALNAFPKVFKAKCINHSFALDAHQKINDYPLAPGYVILAVIPDMNKLKAMQQFEPRVPVSMLEAIQHYLSKKTSPFVRLRVMNPRYEKVQFCLRVQLYPGKDENYYKEKLKQDLREFLAPWAVGEYDKLSFGQCINQSDIIRFLESRDYIDFIADIKMRHEDKAINEEEVCPITPRSILIAGNIDVCIQTPGCEDWSEENACTNQAIPLKTICPNP